MTIRILALFLLALPLGARAGWNLRNNAELAPQYRHLNQKGYAGNSELYDIFGMINSHLEWSTGTDSAKWLIEVKPEIRAVQGRGVLNAPPSEVSVQTSSRVLNSRRTLIQNEELEAFFDFDRLNLRHTFENGEAFIGRKPLSLGVLRFFPVWNKLTLPLIFQPGPEWVENPDVVGASYQNGRFAYRAFASRGNTPKIDDIVLAEIRFFGKGMELQTLAGYWWEHTAIGVAGAFDAFSSTLRLESLWFSEHENESSQLQLGMGIERALGSKWTFVSEALYQSNGQSEFKNVASLPSRFTVLGGKAYLLPYVTYQLHSLWLLNFGFLASLSKDPTYVALGGFDYSLNDNTSLTLKVKWPFGSDDGEFGRERIAAFGRTLGMSSTALLQLQTTF